MSAFYHHHQLALCTLERGAFFFVLLRHFSTGTVGARRRESSNPWIYVLCELIAIQHKRCQPSCDVMRRTCLILPYTTFSPQTKNGSCQGSQSSRQAIVMVWRGERSGCAWRVWVSCPLASAACALISWIDEEDWDRIPGTVDGSILTHSWLSDVMYEVRVWGQMRGRGKIIRLQASKSKFVMVPLVFVCVYTDSMFCVNVFFSLSLALLYICTNLSNYINGWDNRKPTNNSRERNAHFCVATSDKRAIFRSGRVLEGFVIAMEHAF